MYHSDNLVVAPLFIFITVLIVALPAPGIAPKMDKSYFLKFPDLSTLFLGSCFVLF